jgi:hypothetical protein
VPHDQLTLRERAALLALMAEARELTNAELRAVAGFPLDGRPRRRLNEQKLVASRRTGRSFTHELTDDGWAWCRAELGASRPERAGYGGGALYALLAGLDRYLARSGLQLSDAFRPDVEMQVRAAYRRLGKPGHWARIAALREELPDVPRDAVDAELERLAATPGVHVRAASDQKALTEADHASAVRFGGDDRHLLMVEAG